MRYSLFFLAATIACGAEDESMRQRDRQLQNDVRVIAQGTRAPASREELAEHTIQPLAKDGVGTDVGGVYLTPFVAPSDMRVGRIVSVAYLPPFGHSSSNCVFALYKTTNKRSVFQAYKDRKFGGGDARTASEMRLLGVSSEGVVPTDSVAIRIVVDFNPSIELTRGDSYAVAYMVGFADAFIGLTLMGGLAAEGAPKSYFAAAPHTDFGDFPEQTIIDGSDSLLATPYLRLLSDEAVAASQEW